jgi:hypothetical protein
VFRWFLRALLILTICVGTSPSTDRLTLVGVTAQAPLVEIDVARGSEREQKTKRTLEQVLATYDLKRYTFTRGALSSKKGPSTTPFQS